ncbi:PAS domain S-box protein [Prosthecobacter sp. SYSU 5D2]|uniref:PAS domain S-box protein n=1 Tax=Prosthecobacter sp. SYSU 5D2 TaxID=3134134 RepID=UPI0031FEB066
MSEPRSKTYAEDPPIRNEPFSAGRERAESILQSITDGYHVTDAQGRLTEINAAAREMLEDQGMDSESLLGRRIFGEVLTEARETEAAKAFERTLAKRVPTEVEHFYEPWQRWHFVRHFPLPDGGVATFFLDFTERKLLTAAHETFRHLVENAPFGVYVVDGDFRLMHISRGAQKVFQNVAEPLGRDFGEVLRMIWEEPFASEAISIFRHTQVTGEAYHSKRTVEKRHDIGDVESYDWKVERIVLPDGRHGVVCHFYDLSERQAAEARATFLSQLSQKLATVNDAMEINRIATREVGTFFNVHRCYFFEVAEDAEEITVLPDWRQGGEDLAGVYLTRDFGRAEWWHTAARVPLGIDDVSCHEWTRDYAENYLPVDIQAYALAPFLRNGRWVASIGISSPAPRLWTSEELALLENVVARVWPLIDRARAEAARRESETRLQLALNASGMGTFIWHVQEDRAEADERFLELFGVPGGEINHKTALAKRVHPDDLQHYASAVANAVAAGGKGVLRVEARILQPDGSYRWLIVTGQTSFDAQSGAAVRMAGAAMDITDSKLAEEQLRQSEERFRAVFEQTTTGIAQTDLTGRFVQMNDRYCEMVGRSREELLQLRMHDITHPEDLKSNAPLFKALAEGSGSNFVIEKRYVRPDGSILWTHNDVVAIRSASGQPRFIAATVTDITENRRAQEQLRQSEERFRAFVTTSSDSMYRMNADWTVMHQLQGKEFITNTDHAIRDWLQKYIPPEDQKLVTDTVRKAIESKGSFNLEHRIIRADGSLGWTFSHAVPLLDERGEIVEWFGTASDFTERKMAEVALRESETRFRHMANNAPVMVWITEADGRCTFLSESWYEFTGQTPETGMGYGWVDATHPDDHDMVEADFISANERRAPFKVEYRLRRRDGEYRWAIDAATPRFDSNGEFLGYIGSVIDITERKLAEEALRTSERRKTALIELADLLRELRDPADLAYSAAELLGRALNVSRCGYGTINTKEETITIERDWNAPGIQSLAGVLHFRDYGSYIEDLKRGHAVIFSDAYKDPRTADNADALKAISAQAVVNLPVTEDGGFVAILYLNHEDAREWTEDEVSFIREVAERTRIATERRRTEQALRASMEEAARGHEKAEMASRAKDDFLAALSHELRTPLNPVLMVASELANNDTLPEKVREDLRMIQRNIGLEARLIDDLLDLTRISRGMLHIHAEKVDTHALLRHTEEIVRADLHGRKLDLQMHLEAAESFVQADPARLQQVFWNLLKNAVKFTPDGGRIKVRTANPEPGRLLISIEDSGRGIPSEALDRIFLPFEQGDLGGRHAFGGLGLGLSISKALVDLHEGSLQATSAGQDQGSTFTVDLATTQRALPETAPKDLSSADVRPLRLLIVEDDVTSLNVLVKLMQRRGHAVYSASTVAAALELAASHSFDLVISDLGLPDGTGQELMKEIRQRYGWPGIALSGFGMEADLQASKDAGFAIHLVKPVAAADLTRAIASIQEN